MTTRLSRSLSAALVLCIPVVFLTGCSKDTDTNAAPPVNTSTARPDPPNPDKVKNMPQGEAPVAAPTDKVFK